MGVLAHRLLEAAQESEAKDEIKGVKAKTSPIEISASKMAIYSMLVNFVFLM
jgi:hypothetical protein